MIDVGLLVESLPQIGAIFLAGLAIVWTALQWSLPPEAGGWEVGES